MIECCQGFGQEKILSRIFLLVKRFNGAILFPSSIKMQKIVGDLSRIGVNVGVNFQMWVTWHIYIYIYIHIYIYTYIYIYYM